MDGAYNKRGRYGKYLEILLGKYKFRVNLQDLGQDKTIDWLWSRS
jgi:hypothetical protein